MKCTIMLMMLSVLPSVLSAGGICIYEISSADTRLASAGWSARAQDPSTLFTNPAGMTRICGPQVELGAQPIFAHTHFTPDEDETNVSGGDGCASIWLPSGSFFYVRPCSDSLTVGIGNLGYFGSDLVYNHHWVGRYYVQKILLQGISLVPAAAYRINDQWSIGVGLNIMYGFFKQRAAVNNFTDRLSDGYFNAHDYRFGYGGIAGVLYEYSPDTRFGIQYVSPVDLNFRAKPNFENTGPLLTDILKRVGIIGSTLNLRVQVPQGVVVSAYHDLNSCWTIMGNVGWQQWSNFENVSLSLADMGQRTLRIKNEFQDTWHVSAGLEWHWSQCLTLSGGIAYDSSAVSNKNRALDFPVGDQWRFGTGYRWEYSESLIFDFSAELLWQGNLPADVNKGVIAGHVDGTFENTYAVFTCINVSYEF